MAEANALRTQPVINLPDTDRAEFISKVYGHLAMAIGAFIAFETLLFMSGIAERFFDFVYGEGGGGGRWLIILGGFMVGSWIASQAAADIFNPGKQYAGLFGMAALYSLLFAPMLYYTFNFQGSGNVWAAAVITAIGFAALSAVGYFTRSDLSWMRPILMWGGVVAIGLIVGAVIFNFNLGLWFSVAMVALMGVSILYQTQNIVRRYPGDAYVAAAVSLFSSVMTMFWYVLRILNRR